MEQIKKDKNKNIENDVQQHSMVCNDQLFFQELKIAAEEAERDYQENNEED